jgi:hypothetical protein
MTRIEWGTNGDPQYELGVDRGVLHVVGKDLVPWNGLISVTESEVAGSQLRSQFDGVTYANIQFGGFYQCSVTAYGFPDELCEVVGLKEVYAGFYLTGQPRVEFDFAYRTLVGDDGYKMHFVHNALASPKKRGSATLSGSTKAEAFEWSIMARPPTGLEHRATAHLVVDSTKVSSEALLAIEAAVYGALDGSTDPYFPTQQELIVMAGS